MISPRKFKTFFGVVITIALIGAALGLTIYGLLALILYKVAVQM